jgi:hypothetical protein
MFKILGRVEEIEEHLKEKKYPGKIKLEVMGKKESIIADETITLKSGDVKIIKIKEIDIEPNTIVFISAYAKHSIGTTLSIGEEIPMPYDSKRIGKYATFIAAKDGKINKGEIIGSLIMIHGE